MNSLKLLTCIFLSTFGILCLKAEELIKNADFLQCDGKTGIPLYWALNKKLTGERISDAERKGKYCLKLETGKKTSLWIQKNLALTANKKYNVKYSVKAPKGKLVKVYVEWFRKNKDGKKKWANAIGEKIAGTGKWQTIKFSFMYPAGVLPAYICLRGEPLGTYLFRDISIKTVSENREKIPVKKIFHPPEVAEKFQKSRKLLLNEKKRVAIVKEKLEKGLYSLNYEIRTKTLPESGGFPWFRTCAKSKNSSLESDWDDCMEHWQKKTFEFPVTTDSTVTLTFELKNKGAVFLKNIFLKRGKNAQKAFSHIILESPLYRNTFFKVKNPVVSGTITKYGKKISNIQLQLFSPEEIEIFKKNYQVVDSKTKFSIPLELPKDGNYQLKVTFFDKNDKTVAKDIKVIKYCEKSYIDITMRSDNIFKVKGKALYPIILWECPSTEKFLKTIKKGGFNIFMSVPDENIIKKAEKNDLMVICRVDKLLRHVKGVKDVSRRAEYVINKLKPVLESPAVLGYMLSDEPLWTGKPLNELKYLYNELKKLDPSRPVFINAAPRNSVRKLAEFTKACDVYGVDIYPVPASFRHSNLKDQSISSVGRYTEKMLKTVNHRKPVWMSLQGFAWEHLRDRTKKAIYPSFHELRFMSYSSIVNGANGIAIWGTQYIVSPDYWETIMRVTRELSSMSPILLSRKMVKKSEVMNTDKRVKLFTRRYKNKIYIIAINESNDYFKTCIKVPAKINLMNVLFENQKIKITERKLITAFKPYDVHIFTNDINFREQENKKLSETFRTLIKKTKVKKYMGKAKWIWYPGENKKSFSKCYLKKVINIEDNIKNAEIILAVDDKCILYVNGKKIGGNSNWTTASKYDLSQVLKKGKNVLYIAAQDLGVAPCGFLCELIIITSNGKRIITSDSSWRAGLLDKWLETPVEYADSISVNAEIIGNYGIAPWKKRVFVPVP